MGQVEERVDNRSHLWCPVRSSPSFAEVSAAAGVGGRAADEEETAVAVVVGVEGDHGRGSLDSGVAVPSGKGTVAVEEIAAVVAAYCKHYKG